MYQINEQPDRVELRAVLARVLWDGEAPRENMGIEIAASIIGCKWAGGGFSTPFLILGSEENHEDVNCLDSFDTGLRLAKRKGTDIGKALTFVADWMQIADLTGVNRDYPEAPARALAWFLLTDGGS